LTSANRHIDERKAHLSPFFKSKFPRRIHQCSELFHKGDLYSFFSAC